MDDKMLLLESIRKEVDEIDRKITELLDERCRRSLEIGKIKRELGIPFYSAGREKHIRKNVMSLGSRFIGGETLGRIYSVILEESLNLQKGEQKHQ